MTPQEVIWFKYKERAYLVENEESSPRKVFDVFLNQIGNSLAEEENFV